MHLEKIELTAPSNIALIKYWGKVDGQYPMNASLSFTLKKCATFLKVSFKKRNDQKISINRFIFAGERNEKFQKQIEQKIDKAFSQISYPFGVDLEIESQNTFPHSSGIASSASSMAAMAKMFSQIFNIKEHSWISSLAREFSGSAARSVDNGWFSFGKTECINDSHQSYATKINHLVHPEFNSLQDWIFVCSKGEKKISSSLGHELMQNHPYRQQRCVDANNNFSKMLNLLKNKPSFDFFNLIEQEALSLHALMMTSNPPYLLLEAQTVNLMHKTAELRKEGIACGFTLDAGATLHLLFLKKDEVVMREKLNAGFFGKLGSDYYDLIQDECLS